MYQKNIIYIGKIQYISERYNIYRKDTSERYLYIGKIPIHQHIYNAEETHNTVLGHLSEEHGPHGSSY